MGGYHFGGILLAEETASHPDWLKSVARNVLAQSVFEGKLPKFMAFFLLYLPFLMQRHKSRKQLQSVKI